MNLFLMRHCEPKPGAQMDATRGLTATGERQAHDMAAFLVREIGRVDIVLTSPFARAAETADIMAEALGAHVASSTMLEPNRKPADAWAEIERLAQQSSDVLVVGHHPEIGHLIDYVAKVTGIAHDFRHGSIALVDTTRPALLWLVTPSIVERAEQFDAEEAGALVEVTEEIAGALELIEEWVTIKGRHIDIGDAGAPSKSDLAKLAYRGGTKAEQDMAEETEHELAAALKMTKSPDNKPFDLFTSKVGVEVKTLTSGTNDKITMKADAIARKEEGVKKMKLSRTYTVVVDKRPAGVGTSTGKTRYFVRAGYGSFRVGSMTEVPNTAALAKFMKLKVTA